MRERRWVRRVLIASAMAAVILTTIAPDALATSITGGITGGGTWEGTLTLPVFPCPSLSCGGSLTGVFVGSLSGLDNNGNRYTVIWPDPTQPMPASNLSAAFGYDDLCPVAATGEAGGTFGITGGYVDDNGIVAHDGAISGGFGGTRVGALVVVILSGEVVTGNGTTLGTQQLPGAGVGAFVPEGVTTCITVGSISAIITGGALQPE